MRCAAFARTADRAATTGGSTQLIVPPRSDTEVPAPQAAAEPPQLDVDDTQLNLAAALVSASLDGVPPPLPEPIGAPRAADIGPMTPASTN